MRAAELKIVEKMAYVFNIGLTFTLFVVPIVQPMFVFLFFIKALDGELDAAVAFTTIALFLRMQR